MRNLTDADIQLLETNGVTTAQVASFDSLIPGAEELTLEAVIGGIQMLKEHLATRAATAPVLANGEDAKGIAADVVGTV